MASGRRDKPPLAECPWPWTDYGKRDSRDRRRSEAIQIRTTVRGLARPRASTTVERRQGEIGGHQQARRTAISGGCWCTVLVRSLDGGSGRPHTKRHGSSGYWRAGPPMLGPFTQRYVMRHRSPQNLESALGAQSCQLRRPSADLWRPSEGPDEHHWSKGTSGRNSTPQIRR